MRARRKVIETMTPVHPTGGLAKIRIKVPEEGASNVQILGNDVDVVPKVIQLFRGLEII